MDLKKLNKEELLAQAEQLAAANTELTASNEELVAKNEQLTADLAAAPKGGNKELQKELDAAKEEVAALQGVVEDLNEKQILADKTRGSKKPVGTIEVDGVKKHLEVVHGVRRGQKVCTPAEIAADPDHLKSLYNKQSSAVRVVG